MTELSTNSSLTQTCENIVPFYVNLFLDLLFSLNFHGGSLQEV